MDVSRSGNQSEASCSSQTVKYIKCTRKHASDTDEEGDNELTHKAPPTSKLSTSIYEYLVLISIILIIFAAFRNSVTW